MTSSSLNHTGFAQIIVGVSSCLIGNRVRYDADHSLNRYITELIGKQVTLVPVCPEVELGMSVPREKVQLEGEAESPRMIGIDSGQDWTDKMNNYSVTRFQKADLKNLSGFILKCKSPSCGIEKVKLFPKQGPMKRIGTGLFASNIMRLFPDLPIIEECHLTNPDLCEKFIKRIIAYHKLQ